MKITKDNVLEQYPGIRVKLPEALGKDTFEYIKENMDLYNEDETIKKVIDTFVLKLNKYIAKEESQKIKPETDKKRSTQKTDKTESKKVRPSEKPVKKRISTTKPQVKKEVKEPHNVEHFTIEERFIKRYLLLHGKAKKKNHILNFIKALQKSITEKTIRKSSKYADIIETIQKELIRLYNTEKADEFIVKLDDKSIDKYRSIVGDLKVRLSVVYIKRFIGLYGRETKEKVERLLGLIKKAISSGKIPNNDPYITQIKRIEKALTDYLDSGEIDVTTTELKGLAGIAGCSYYYPRKKKVTSGNVYKHSDVVSSLDLKNTNFKLAGFTGIWKKIIGDPEIPFQIMIYGSGGKGKSTFGVKFATYLSKGLNKKVLYIADEEKISGKLRSKFEIFNSYNKNLDVTGKMRESFKNFDIVFIDSVTSIGIEPEEFGEIIEKNPGISFIYILQTNKKGNFYGKKKWEHLGDVVLRFEDGMVGVEKNRFGKVGDFRL